MNISSSPFRVTIELITLKITVGFIKICTNYPVINGYKKEMDNIGCIVGDHDIVFVIRKMQKINFKL